MSGVDAASILLSIPGHVEQFVKTCRAVKEYKELDSTYSDLMQRAILDSQHFKHLSSLILDPTAYSAATQGYIAQLVRQSKLSMERALTIVNDWKTRLGIREGATGSRAKRLIPSFFHCFKSNSAESQEEKASYVRERLAEAEYMIVGKLEIATAMESMEHYLDKLNLAILTSDRLSVSPKDAEDTSDNIQFVVQAKNRVEQNIALNFIDGKTLKPLSDVDPQTPTGIFRAQSGPYSGCIVDPRNVYHYAGENIHIAWEETTNIARLLAEDPNVSNYRLSSSVGILPSCGYAQLDTHLHAVVLRLPPGIASPRTLRSLLAEGELKHSLRDRIDFSIKLATSVLVVHSLGLVHKSIRPDSIIVTEDSFGSPGLSYPYKLGIPYLLAFDSSRTSKGTTMKHPLAGPEGHLWQILYRHPRHFPDRVYKYEMRDDVYSLGICLFEVALCKSLFRWNHSENAFEEDNSLLDLSDERCETEAKALGRPINTNMMWLRRRFLVEAAKELIPPRLGDLFKDVVVACLKFGEPSSGPEGEISWSSDSDLSPDDQSIHFVQDVLTKLHTIKLA